ncbi:MAG: type IV secretory system conjugative DNA transfer family protein [Acidimicrobiales bacterium]
MSAPGTPRPPTSEDGPLLAAIGLVCIVALAHRTRISVQLALAAALVVGTGLLVVAGAAHRGRPLVPRSGWAGRRDLASLRVRSPVAGRLTLGTTRRGVLVAAERRASVLVLGPSQSGKTTGLAIPAILEWQGPVVATSVKADLVRATIDERARAGPTWIYDPTGATGLPGAGWSPLAACTTWQGARRIAAWLCGAARSGASGLSDEEFWYTAAGKLLAPYLLAAASSGRDLGQVVQWIDRQDETEVEQILMRAGQDGAVLAAAASWQRDERTRSSVFTTAEMVLEAYADPSVLASSARCDIDPSLLLGGGAPTLYICAPSYEQDRLRPVFATLLQTIVTAAYDGVLRRGAPQDPPLLLVLDEAANIAPLRELDAIASTAAGHGVQLVTVWQDLAQLRSRYGERASTVINNHRAKLILSGVSDPATLEYASRLIGDADTREHSVTTDPTGGRSTTRSSRERRLASDAELRRIRPGEGVLLYGHLPPARIRLRPRTNP